MPTQPEFVFEEEAAVKRRGWSENLQFYTGLGYLSGARSSQATWLSFAVYARAQATALAGAKADAFACVRAPAGGVVGVSAGGYQYVTVKPEIPLTSLKLKANRILNMAGTGQECMHASGTR